TESQTNQKFTAVTDQQGLFKVEGIPAGTYTVTVSMQGFSEAEHTDVKVEEGATATVDFKLEIARVEAAVTVEANGLKPNSDTTYQALRQMGNKEDDFGGPYAAVNNLVLKRDAATFTLRSGEVYFGPVVEGKHTASVFIGEGEMTLV